MIRYRDYDDWKVLSRDTSDPVSECEGCGTELFEGDTVYEVHKNLYVCDKKECLAEYFILDKKILGE